MKMFSRSTPHTVLFTAVDLAYCAKREKKMETLAAIKSHQPAAHELCAAQRYIVGVKVKIKSNQKSELIARRSEEILARGIRPLVDYE